MSAADVPVVILCGGMGTRLREASEKLPKPLVNIGGKPRCLGYKGDLIKRWFLDYQATTSDFALHMGRTTGSSSTTRTGTRTGRSPSPRQGCSPARGRHRRDGVQREAHAR